MLKLSSAALLAAGFVALIGSARTANATDITFDGYPDAAIGSSIDTDGYIFSSPLGQPDTFFSDGDGGPNSADPSPTSATAQLNYGDTYFSLTNRSGRPFILSSMDFADVYNTGQQTTFEVTYSFTGGGGATENYTLDDKVGLQTIHFSQRPVDRVDFMVTSFPNPEFQFDNVRVSDDLTATPLPASLPLFVSALGGLGFVGYRRRAK